MRQKLLIGAAFCGSLFMMSGSGVAYGQTCTASPSCTELGYTKTQSECGEDGIKCPFGNLWSCRPVRASCQIGWIYYADRTCLPPVEHDTSKVALGVVVYLDESGEHGQVMSAWHVDKNGNKSSSKVVMYWATEYVDISSLPNYTSYELAKTDFNSCDNTDKIVKLGGVSSYPAAWAARSYVPTTETKGKWCLPAAGVVTSIYNNRGVVQDGIRKLGGVDNWNNLWSSSEYSDFGAWYSDLSRSNSVDWANKSIYSYVRPVMEF